MLAMNDSRSPRRTAHAKAHRTARCTFPGSVMPSKYSFPQFSYRVALAAP